MLNMRWITASSFLLKSANEAYKQLTESIYKHLLSHYKYSLEPRPHPTSNKTWLEVDLSYSRLVQVLIKHPLHTVVFLPCPITAEPLLVITQDKNLCHRIVVYCTVPMTMMADSLENDCVIGYKPLYCIRTWHSAGGACIGRLQHFAWRGKHLQLPSGSPSGSIPMVFIPRACISSRTNFQLFMNWGKNFGLGWICGIFRPLKFCQGTKEVVHMTLFLTHTHTHHRDTHCDIHTHTHRLACTHYLL